MEEKKIKIAVPKGIEPTRIDIFLAGNDKIELSRTQIKKMIGEKLIMIPDKGVKPNFILRGGETIEVTIPEEVPFRLIAQDIPLNIVFEDEYLMIVNKPPGMVVHPARGNWEGTLLNAILHHTREISRIGGDHRPGIVHRLDKATSGLLIFAKSEKAHRKLTYMLEKRRIHRTYQALVWGIPKKFKMTIDLPLGHNPKDHKKRAVVPGGKESLTVYEVIKLYDFTSHLSIKLHTGRTHQIRVHMNHIGHPVFGDPDYGGRDERLGGVAPQFREKAKRLLELIDRQALHAKTLGFMHPISGEKLSFDSELPDDIQNIIDNL
ncbi:RluA family pseudouridine synthase [bacterium]|nr:RluA family pseudouridine synthase [bacterium]